MQRRACGLRLRHAGARHRADLAVRQRRRRKRAGCHAVAARGRRSPPSPCRSRGRLGRERPGHVPPGARATNTSSNGTKTWISNGGIADVYTVFARTGEGPGAKGLSAFLVPADTPGLEIVERIDVIAPHPLAALRFDDCRLPAERV
ncbi:MAG: acyl-CoA dehydrogenase family protein [Arhodomonas sp.]|nr:acyl-CoA dehydrogenase family protein [Arhodomonas sp.]